MLSRSLCVLALGLLVQDCRGAAISWVGSTIRDNQWTTTYNWSPNGVPGPNDDVRIDLANATVVLNAECNVRSLHVGKGASLTVFHDLGVSAGLIVEGTLVHDNALQVIDANATISGTWDWRSGEASGSWQIAKSAKAQLDGLSQRMVKSGTLDNYGTMTVSGVLAMNASGKINNYGTINAGGNFTQIMSFDSSPCVFNSSAGSMSFSGKVLRVMSHAVIGAFDWRAGAVEVFGNVLFTSDVVYKSSPATYLSCQGNAEVTFGGKVELGKGSLLDLRASVTIGSGSIYNVSITAGASTLKNVAAEDCRMMGGFAYFSSVTCTQLVVNAGTLTVTGDSTADFLGLNAGIISSEGGASIVSKTVNVSTTTAVAGNVIHVTGQGRYAAGTVLSGGLNVGSGAVVTSTGSVTLRQSSAAFAVDGILAVDSGLLTVNAGQWTGKGKIDVSPHAELDFVSGSNVVLPLLTVGSGAKIGALSTYLKADEIKFSSSGTVSNGPGFTMKCMGSCFDLYIPGYGPHQFMLTAE